MQAARSMSPPAHRSYPSNPRKPCENNHNWQQGWCRGLMPCGSGNNPRQIAVSGPEIRDPCARLMGDASARNAGPPEGPATHESGCTYIPAMGRITRIPLFRYPRCRGRRFATADRGARRTRCNERSEARSSDPMRATCWTSTTSIWPIPDSVDPDSRAYFSTFYPDEIQPVNSLAPVSTPGRRRLPRPVSLSQDRGAAVELANGIREYGHLAVRTDPLGSDPPDAPEIQAETYGISDADLESLPAEVVGGPLAKGAANAAEAIARLRAAYIGASALISITSRSPRNVPGSPMPSSRAVSRSASTATPNEAARAAFPGRGLRAFPSPDLSRPEAIFH